MWGPEIQASNEAKSGVRPAMAGAKPGGEGLG